MDCRASLINRAGSGASSAIVYLGNLAFDELGIIGAAASVCGLKAFDTLQAVAAKQLDQLLPRCSESSQRPQFLERLLIEINMFVSDLDGIVGFRSDRFGQAT